MTTMPAVEAVPRDRGSAFTCACGLVGVGATLAGGWTFRNVQFNVVRYSTSLTAAFDYLGASAFALGLLIVLFIVAWRSDPSGSMGRRVLCALSLLAPLALNAPLVYCAIAGAAPPFILSLAWISTMGWSAWRVGQGWVSPKFMGTDGASLGVALGVTIACLVIAATVVHTRLQIAFFEHFMLGHADFGHYLEELKNALAGRGLRCDSFANTRLGWHFSPSLFVMAPFYRLWPSPILLMVCSALLLHVGALPVYFISRRLSGSAWAAFFFAVAWLLHPSISRMVYSSTYGFQWVYVAIPLTLCAFGALWSSRWLTFGLLVAAILLVQETTAAAVFGIGLSMLLFAPLRGKGYVVTGVSIVFFVLCVGWVIPAFAASGRYERMDLFGQLGGSFGELVGTALRHPGEFLARWSRPEGWSLLVVLLSALAFLPIRQWRITLAAAPSLVLVFLLDNRDWLSIKFWHQAAAVPIFFCAAMKSLTARGAVREGGSMYGAPLVRPVGDHRRRCVSIGLAIVVSSAWSHCFYGFSPLSKSFEVFAADANLQKPDPRLEIVQRLRGEIPRDWTILATERLAAHFTDYKRLYTGRRWRETHCVVIDRSDTWDTSGLAGRVDEFTRNGNYRVQSEIGSIIVFVRALDAPPIVVEE